MKTRNQILGLIAIAIMAIIALPLAGCKSGEPADTPNPTTGGTQEQPPVDNTKVGEVTIGGKTIPVHKTEGVSDADATATLNGLKAAIPNLNPGAPAYFADNITRIEIGGTGFALNAGVLRIKSGVSGPAIAANLNAIYAASLTP